MRWPKFLKAAADFKPDFEFAGTLDIRATQTKEGEEPKLPSFSMVANTGEPMLPQGFVTPVVIDLSGVSFYKDRTPLIADHDPTKRVGHVTKQWVNAEGIFADGVISSTSSIALELTADAKNGFPMEVSVGAKILKGRRIEAGKTVQINGRTYKGPLIHAQQILVREFTATTLGADGRTALNIAASLGEATHMNEEFKKWLIANALDPDTLGEEAAAKLEAQFGELNTLKAAATKGGSTATLEPDEIEAAANKTINAVREKQVLEDERCEKIRDLFARYDEIEFVEHEGKKIKASAYKRTAIKDGIDPLKVENTLMRAGLSGGANMQGPAIHVKLPVAQSDIAADAIACAVIRGQFNLPSQIKGHDGRDYGYESQFTEQVLEASEHRELRNISLHQIMDMTIAATNGVGYGIGNRRSDDFIDAYVRAAISLQAGGEFSTLTVAHIFENVANKTLLMRHMMSKSTWKLIAYQKRLEDFKPASLYRIDSDLGYRPLNTQGEIEHGRLQDTKRTVQADTRAIMIGLDRKHIINDDMGALSEILNGLVDGSEWAIESEVYATLLGNEDNFFDVANNNLIDDPLSLGGYEMAEIAFSQHVGLGGKPISASPALVLAGTALATRSQNLYTQTTLLSVDANEDQIGQRNIYQGRYRPVISPYLNVTTIRRPGGATIPNQSATKWFLLPEPNPSSPVVIGLLNGRAVPTIKSAETSFNTLGMQWRGYHDFGAAQGDKEYAVMSTGDGSGS